MSRTFSDQEESEAVCRGTLKRGRKGKGGGRIVGQSGVARASFFKKRGQSVYMAD